jgi:hypothetical protein
MYELNWKKDEFSAKIAPLADTSWIRKRYVFDEYVENGE